MHACIHNNDSDTLVIFNSGVSSIINIRFICIVIIL